VRWSGAAVWLAFQFRSGDDEEGGLLWEMLAMSQEGMRT
jgi:hypothetical protein